MENDFSDVFNKALDGHPVVFMDTTINAEFDVGEVLYIRVNPVFPSDILILGDKGNSYSVNKLRLLYSGMELWEEPLEFYHWHLIKDEFEYIFKCKAFGWVTSIEKPTLEGDFWCLGIDDRSYRLGALSDHLFPECDWRNSLLKRSDF